MHFWCLSFSLSLSVFLPFYLNFSFPLLECILILLSVLSLFLSLSYFPFYLALSLDFLSLSCSPLFLPFFLFHLLCLSISLSLVPFFGLFAFILFPLFLLFLFYVHILSPSFSHAFSFHASISHFLYLHSFSRSFLSFFILFLFSHTHPLLRYFFLLEYFLSFS